MGDMNMMAVFLGAVAFFAVGALWYGVLFGKPWRREAGIEDAHGTMLKPRDTAARVALVFGLCFAFELLIALMLGHQFARTSPSARGIMMISTGFGATIMAPAVGINYLFQGKSGKLFAIDAGHLVVGMAAMGAVFVAFMPD
jgi:Protein of unknown function (DUF1761)